MDVPWSFVDAAPPVMATFGGLGPDNDDRSIYPSPPAVPLIMDMESDTSLRQSPVHSKFLDPAPSFETMASNLSTTSSSSSSLPEVEEVVISISTTFYPGNPAISSPTDIVISSNDGVLFYLYSQRLAAAGFTLLAALSPVQGLGLSGLGSCNSFPQEGPIKLSESSVSLSIIFHIVYNISCAAFSPSLDAIAEAITCMSGYHLIPSTLITPSTFMYTYLMAQYAPFQPLELYILAGSHHIEPLAVDASSHLLGINLGKVTDDMASAMGASYLRRLFFMHQGRLERLKKVLIKPPALHDDTDADCDTKKKASLKSKWALMVTNLVWDAKPDISPYAIQQNLRLSAGTTTCPQCEGSWEERIREAVMEWATVKFTI